MKEKNSAHFRRAAIFIAAAMIVQAIFVVFFTPQGLRTVYPYVLRLKSEEIEDDSSFAEYYDLRNEFADADAFFLGADLSVADSYKVILDYIRFTKRYFDISVVALRVGEMSAEKINACLNAPDDALEAAITDFTTSGRYTTEFIAFVRSLCEFNKTLPPKRKLSVKSIYVESVESAVVGRVSSLIMSDPSGMAGEISYAISISAASEFFDYFDEHAAAFEAFLGAEQYARFVETEAHYRAGDYNEWALCEKIAPTLGVPTLYVVDPSIASPQNAFRYAIAALGAKGAFVQVKYSGCQTLSSAGVVDKNDVDLPFASKRSIRFVSGERLEGFRSFYRFVADPSGKGRKDGEIEAIDSFATRDMFIVIGSPAVSYGDKK